MNHNSVLATAHHYTFSVNLPTNLYQVNTPPQVLSAYTFPATLLHAIRFCLEQVTDTEFPRRWTLHFETSQNGSVWGLNGPTQPGTVSVLLRVESDQVPIHKTWNMNSVITPGEYTGEERNVNLSAVRSRAWAVRTLLAGIIREIDAYTHRYLVLPWGDTRRTSGQFRFRSGQGMIEVDVKWGQWSCTIEYFNSIWPHCCKNTTLSKNSLN